MKKKKTRKKKIVSNKRKNQFKTAEELLNIPWYYVSDHENLMFLFSKFMNDENIPLDRFGNYLDSALHKYPALIELFSPIHDSMKDGLIYRFNEVVASNEKLLLVFEKIFYLQRISIQEFVSHKKLYEFTFASGDFELCKSQLESSLDKFGYTFWYLKEKFTLLGYLNKSAELAKFYNDLERDFEGTSFVQHLVSNVYWLANTASPQVTFKGNILNNIKEYNQPNSGVSWAASILSHVTSPYLENNQRYYDSFLTGAQHQFSVYDQYVLVTDWLLSEESQSIDESRKLNILENIYESSKDGKIKRALDIESELYETDISKLGQSILEEYTVGNYSKVISYLHESFQDLVSPEVYFMVFAKSLAYRHEKYDDTSSPIKVLIGKTASLIGGNSNTELLIEEISMLRYKLHHHSWFKSIDACLLNICPYLFDADFKLLSKSSLINSTETNPRCLSEVKGENLCSFCSNFSDDQIPEYRITKYNFFEILEQKEEFESNIQRIRESEEIDADKILLISELYLNKRDNDGLISFCSEVLAHNENNYIFLPLKLVHELLSDIDENTSNSLDKLLTCFYISKLVYKSDTTLLSELFQDYIHSINVTKPSELLNRYDSFDALKAEVFFRDVCNEGVLDYLFALEGSVDVKLERLTLIDFLKENGVIEDIEYEDEKSKIYDSIVTETALANLSANKITLNSDGILEKVQDEVSSLVSKYKLEDDIETDDLIKQKLSNEEFVTIAASSKNTIIERILNLVLDVFLNDEDFGLDINLSGEIRHGFFDNTMRSMLIQHKLLEVDKDSKAYWVEHYKSLSLAKRLLRDLEEGLEDFRKKFDELIKTAETWMKVSISAQEGRVFDYSEFSEEVFIDAKALLENDCSDKELISYFIEYFTSLTLDKVIKIREKINKEFRDKLGLLLEELSEIQGVVEFSEEVNKAKSHSNEVITEVTGWFDIATNSKIFVHGLNQLVSISQESFKKIKNSTVDFQVTDKSQYASQINNDHSRAIIIALINCYDNALKYGDKGLRTKISLDIFQGVGPFEIVISNTITSSHMKKMKNGLLDEIKADLENMDLHKLKVEGGTGLVKVVHYLSSLDSSYTVEVGLDVNCFKVSIKSG